MAQPNTILKISSPRVFLLRMLVFLILAGFVALILYRQIAVAFLANPGLNGLILGVLGVGILLGLRQVTRLMPEIRWINSAAGVGRPGAAPPVLLAPMATMLGETQGGLRAISTLTLRTVLDSVGTRLDESREIARYLTGLLVFLGLLGTFWGLLQTVASIAGVIKSMGGSGDAAVMFDDLKHGLAAPIAGMSVSFTSSLFGLAGSLVLGFLDLQAGQAQNRFYNELEELLSASTNTDLQPPAFSPDMSGQNPGMAPDLKAALDKIATSSDTSNSRATTVAMANLAEGIQGLVQHMRSEQQLIRDWVEAQASRDGEIRALLERMAQERERPAAERERLPLDRERSAPARELR